MCVWYILSLQTRQVLFFFFLKTGTLIAFSQSSGLLYPILHSQFPSSHIDVLLNFSSGLLGIFFQHPSIHPFSYFLYKICFILGYSLTLTCVFHVVSSDWFQFLFECLYESNFNRMFVYKHSKGFLCLKISLGNPHF